MSRPSLVEHCPWCRDGQKVIPGVTGCWCGCHVRQTSHTWKERAERLRLRVIEGRRT